MRALVTGGCGFIGTNLIKRLSNNNHKEYCENIVVSIDDYSTGSGDNEIECNGVQYFGGDISKVTDYSNIIDDCDIIFHLAAKARIQPSFETPTEYFQSNAAGTQNILEWARKNGNIPVVYAGSSSKHGDIYSNPYTFTKWQGEQLCEMYSKLYNLPVTICRFYNVYGPHQLTEGEYCTVIGIFESLYKKDKPLTITGDGEQRRDFTHVDDIVDAMMRVVYCNKWGSVYELGRGQNHSINEVVDMFGSERVYIDEISGEVRETLCRSELARKKLKWNPKINLEDWIKEQL